MIEILLWGFGATIFLFILSGGPDAWRGKDPYRNSNPLDTESGDDQHD